ncbi:MAG: hypothetical protein JO041_10080 [Acidobacteria bacterium]|nr:hypothetical protein [Acidobacteriota bacterium]
MKGSRDEDLGKGAVERETQQQQGNQNFSGQMPHRNQHAVAAGLDSDFPEAGGNPEHSGQQISNQHDRALETACGRTQQESERVDQDPGERQKRNQDGQKDDPLAA